MKNLGNSLLTLFFVRREPFTLKSDRLTNRSDGDFLDRHCRELLAAIDTLKSDRLEQPDANIGLDRKEGWTDSQFVTEYRAELAGAYGA